MGIGAAIIGSAVIGAGASVLNSKAQKDASQRSARAIKKSTDQSVAEQRRQFDTMLGLTEPRRDAENAALNQLLNVLGIGEETVDLSGLQIPGQDFAINEGSRAIERSAAARGGLVSGNTLTALQDRAQGIASQNFLSHYLAPLQNMALGNANMTAGQNALNLGVNVGNTITQGGANRANILAQNNSPWMGINQSVQGGIANYLLMDALKGG